MGGVERVVGELAAWSPYLAAGFAWNIVISLVAMIAGTGGGYLLARWRVSPRRALARTGAAATELTRNIPTFVFQFYLMFMLPDAASWPAIGVSLPFPAWLKAALALALAVAGFVSDHLARILRESRAARCRALPVFVSNWGNFLVTIVMASSTASVIGVPELVSRCNTMIAAIGTTDAMLWVYLYAMGGFFLFCHLATALVAWLSRGLERRYGGDAGFDAEDRHGAI